MVDGFDSYSIAVYDLQSYRSLILVSHLWIIVHVFGFITVQLFKLGLCLSVPVPRILARQSWQGWMKLMYGLFVSQFIE